VRGWLGRGWWGHAVVMGTTVTINDLLDGHVKLDIECLDRVYLNGYVPNLQVAGQVVLSRVRLCGRAVESVLKESQTHGKTTIDPC